MSQLSNEDLEKATGFSVTKSELKEILPKVLLQKDRFFYDFFVVDLERPYLERAIANEQFNPFLVESWDEVREKMQDLSEVFLRREFPSSAVISFDMDPKKKWEEEHPIFKAIYAPFAEDVVLSNVVRLKAPRWREFVAHCVQKDYSLGFYDVFHLFPLGIVQPTLYLGDRDEYGATWEEEKKMAYEDMNAMLAGSERDGLLLPTDVLEFGVRTKKDWEQQMEKIRRRQEKK